MPRGKANTLKQHEKVLTLMLSGNPVTRGEVEKLLGSEIEMYRLSAYVHMIKKIIGGVVKVQKDGRNVLSYQLVNVDEMKKYLDERHASFAKAKGKKVAKVKPKKISKMQDLKAQPVATPAPATETLEVQEI